MNTIQILAQRHNDFKAAKGKPAKIKIAQEIQRLKFQWLREFLSDNPRLLPYLELSEKSSTIPDDLEQDTSKHLKNINKKIDSEIKATGIKRKRTATELEQWKEDSAEFRRASLMLDIELFDSNQLTVEWKITIGKEIIRLWKVARDFYSVSNQKDTINAMVQNQITVITERVMELELNIGEPELHYWPIGAVPFDKAMEDLKNEGFILDTTLAREIFKTQNNPTGQTLKWGNHVTRLQIIYFLLQLYGFRKYKEESITKIAYKIFDFGTKHSPQKDFTSDIRLIERMTVGDAPPMDAYYQLWNILRSK